MSKKQGINQFSDIHETTANGRQPASEFRSTATSLPSSQAPTVERTDLQNEPMISKSEFKSARQRFEAQVMNN
jgi:hypothetical protein